MEEIITYFEERMAVTPQEVLRQLDGRKIQSPAIGSVRKMVTK